MCQYLPTAVRTENPDCIILLGDAPEPVRISSYVLQGVVTVCCQGFGRDDHQKQPAGWLEYKPKRRRSTSCEKWHVFPMASSTQVFREL